VNLKNARCNNKDTKNIYLLGATPTNSIINSMHFNRFRLYFISGFAQLTLVLGLNLNDCVVRMSFCLTEKPED
jgi:hypothetical protein